MKYFIIILLLLGLSSCVHQNKNTETSTQLIPTIMTGTNSEINAEVSPQLIPTIMTDKKSEVPKEANFDNYEKILSAWKNLVPKTSLQITRPSPGDTFYLGEKIDISWEIAGDILENTSSHQYFVQIDLWDEDNKILAYIVGQREKIKAESGTYKWEIPEKLTYPHTKDMFKNLRLDISLHENFNICEQHNFKLRQPPSGAAANLMCNFDRLLTIDSIKQMDIRKSK